MVGNIVGEPIELFVADQIDLRQKIYGAGYNENSLARTPEYLNYLNNRNAWIKLASGVELYDLKQYLLDENQSAYDNAFQQNTDDINQLTAIQGENVTQIENIESQVGDSPYNKGTQRLKDLQKFSTDGYFTENDIKALDGINLAKKYVLFNTIQEYKDNTYVNRSGVRTSKSWSSSQNKIYGGMGSNERGLQPVPGIIGIDVDTINRGSIKKATVTLKAFNKFQFGIIEILYLRLGYTMMLEYGWDKQLKSDKNGNLIIEDVGSTIIENEWFNNKSYSQREMSDIIGDYTSKYGGNYSGFFGKVNNFSWKLNKDNTYDITINLISLGSVIESLEVSIPSAMSIAEKSTQESVYKTTITNELSNNFIDIEDLDEEELKDNIPIALNAGTDSITNFCINAIINMKGYIELGDTNFHYVQHPHTKVKDRYYIRFGHFLDFLQRKVIGEVKNQNSSSPRLEIDTNPENTLVSYIPNLIPLNASTCIFTPKMRNITVGTKDYFENPFGKVGLPGVSNKLKEEFAIQEKGVFYGKLMNVYLNVSFIISSLNSNKDKEENLGLYRFLEALCDGINKTMGNSTKISPAVKDNNIVYFIDENPIQGGDKIFQSEEIKSVPINLFGYNTDGTSNFVKDFGFQTKITPKTMNQISIGATAGGYQNATNAVGYKWWNRGLKNRFEETYEKDYFDPQNLPKTEDDALYESFKSFVRAGYGGDGDRAYRRGDGFDLQYFGYRLYYKNKGKIFYGYDYYDVNSDKTDEENLKSRGLRKDVIQFMKHQNEKEKRKQEIINYDAEVAEFKKYQKSLIQLASVRAIQEQNVFFPLGEMSEDVKSALRNSFKAYKVALQDLSFKKEEVNSNQVGFIPVELSFTCDGLSGWRIYNQLDVNQRELPASYPESLRFIIRGLKDKISGNTWETSIDTISQPPIKKTLNINTFAGASGFSDLGVGTYTGPEENKYTLEQGFSVETPYTKNGLIYFDEVTPKTQVVLHHTADNASVEATINWWRGQRNDEGRGKSIATHFIIQRDGTYDQLFDLKYWAYHLGTDDRSLNKNTISIELESYGYLNSFEDIEGVRYILQDGKSIGKVTDLLPIIYREATFGANYTPYELVRWVDSPSQPISSINYGGRGKQYRGYGNWQGYTYAQISTLYDILLKIQKEYPNIPLGINSVQDYLDMFPPLGEVSQNAIKGAPGIYTHNSYRASAKTYVYPANNLNSMLSGRSNNVGIRNVNVNMKYNAFGYVADYGERQKINFLKEPLKFKSSSSEENNSTQSSTQSSTFTSNRVLNYNNVTVNKSEKIIEDFLGTGRLEYKHTFSYKLPDGSTYTVSAIGLRFSSAKGGTRIQPQQALRERENVKRVAKNKAELLLIKYLDENNIP